MKKTDAVIFDMDGVIFDTERLILDCWVELGEKRNIEGDIRKIFRACIGTTSEKTREIVLDGLGKDFPYDDFCKITSKMFHEKVDAYGMPVKEGVRDTLEAFRQMGMPLGLASSTKLDCVKRELGDAGLLDYFDVVIGGDLLKKSKPEPDIYLLACDRFGMEPSHCVAIEDSYNGIISAYRAGMHPVMIPDLLPPTLEMEEKCDVILKSMTDLIPWFESLGEE